MAAAYITPQKLVEYLYIRAEKLGADAFPHNGRTHYYSGPNSTVLEELKKSYGIHFQKNHARAIDWASRHNATIIDNTPLALFLTKFNSFDQYTDPEDQLLPWKHLSRMFALSMWGHVSTTVCGADTKTGVYFREEISHTIDPQHMNYIAPGAFDADFYQAIFNPSKEQVAYINLRPFNEFKPLYDPYSLLPVHRRVCLSEQRMGLHEAIEGADIKTIKTALQVASQEVCTRPVEAYEYFLDSRERFLLDRENMFKNTKPSAAPFYAQSPTKRAETKKSRLKDFGLMVWSLIETELALMPASKRPNIILPPCLAGAVPTP